MLTGDVFRYTLAYADFFICMLLVGGGGRRSPFSSSYCAIIMEPFNVEEFETFLREAGAILMDATRPGELVRFCTPRGVSSIRKTKKGKLRFYGEAQYAYFSFQGNGEWVAYRKTNRKQLSAAREEIIARDGDRCFYCGKNLTNAPDDVTIEHLLSLKHGGNNHIDNLVLACRHCNMKAGNKPIIEKVKMRERNALTFIYSKLQKLKERRQRRR